MAGCIFSTKIDVALLSHEPIATKISEITGFCIHFLGSIKYRNASLAVSNNMAPLVFRQTWLADNTVVGVVVAHASLPVGCGGSRYPGRLCRSSRMKIVNQANSSYW